MPEPVDPTLRVYQPVTCRECGWQWPFSENKPPPPGAVCLNCDGELERDLGVTAGSDEPTDPTLQVYQRPAADVAHRPGSGRVTADGLTEADVFAGIANGVPLASRRCPGDRHYPGPDVARLATGSLYTCRYCPAEFVIEDDGTEVPVGEAS